MNIRGPPTIPIRNENHIVPWGRYLWGTLQCCGACTVTKSELLQANAQVSQNTLQSSLIRCWLGLVCIAAGMGNVVCLQFKQVLAPEMKCSIYNWVLRKFYLSTGNVLALYNLASMHANGNGVIRSCHTSTEVDSFASHVLPCWLTNEYKQLYYALIVLLI